MATTRKTTKKGGKAQKKDGPRIKRYGCTTYRSEPQDNPDCRGRCSPPARMVSQDGKTKVTQIRYRRRDLDVVRKNCACDVKPSSKTKKTPAKKTAAKPAPAKTAKKAPAKKTVPKAPAKVPTKIKDAIREKAAKTDFGVVLDDAMRAKAMAANLTDWQREVLSRPYIMVYYNEDRNRYLIYGRRAKENADDLTPAEAVQKLKTIGSRTPVIMNPHDPFRGRSAAKSDIIAVLMARPDYAPVKK